MNLGLQEEFIPPVDDAELLPEAPPAPEDAVAALVVNDQLRVEATRRQTRVEFRRVNVDRLAYMRRCSTLNAKQYLFFVDTLFYIHTEQDPPLRSFISGGAGVGKTELLRCIIDALRLYYDQRYLNRDLEKPSVLVTAPTGRAAFHLRGMTLHSAFSLPLNITSVYQKTSDSAFNTLVQNLSQLKVLIIDEISMCGQEMFSSCNLRLQDILNNPRSFGGLHVIICGDLYQLPPVNMLYISLPSYEDMKGDFFPFKKSNKKQPQVTEEIESDTDSSPENEKTQEKEEEKEEEESHNVKANRPLKKMVLPHVMLIVIDKLTTVGVSSECSN
eukprot:Pompholyxophrys_punicea_v1_NODE_102_length_3479_cov_3.570386.p1 type:complete len:329 gc:universal NODE_102_length_3479_cov_3.570386:855-1841(+)